ncbi:MAG: hypothetical protein IKD76_08495 [Clostridia bacterium]|nr:hypothetical protein [Clostridia bacterium]
MYIDIERYFGDYKKDNIEKLNAYISALNSQVKKYYNFGKPFFKGEHTLNYKEYLENCQLNEHPMAPTEIFEYISPLYQNLPNWNNPGTMINVIPPVNLVSMASMSLTELYNPNFAQDTYSGLLITAEMEVVKYISDLVNWNWENSFGVFTFGGKGTNLYATKIALTKACPETKASGCDRNKYFMVTSKNGHPCHYEVCNWLGIGKDNCIEINCDADGRINLKETENVISENIENGKVFLGFNLNGGSTNELTVDPIKDIAELNMKIVNKYNLKYIPHIHVDSVLGWIYLFFNNYNYKENPLNIPEAHLRKIQSLNKKVQEYKYANSLGVDFHKTGFCPYVSSLFIVKERDDFYVLNPDKKINFEDLHYGNYNPFESTLELTRPSSGPIMALTTLKSLGVKGFQEIIAQMFSATEKFRAELLENKNIILINENTEWLATLFIIKPKEYEEYTIEEILKLPEEEISKIKDYNVNYAKYILDRGKRGEISFTFTSSRSYKIPNTEIKLGVLKAYPMSVFFTEEKIENLVAEIFESICMYERNTEELDYEQLSSISDNMVYRN